MAISTVYYHSSPLSLVGAMADQHDSWDEVEVQWGNTATTRNRTEETSGSTDLGPTTDCAVGGDLEPMSVTRREAVQRGSPLLQLAGEDPDAISNFYFLLNGLL